MKRKSPKYRHLITLAISFAILIAINFVGSFSFARIDLTEDKFHTLAESTRELVDEKLDDVLTIEIYLDGNLPSHLQKLKNSIEEKIQEMQVYAGSNIKYRFVNPQDDAQNEDFQKSLNDRGVYSAVAIALEDGKSSQMTVWPGATLYYRDKNESIQFIQGGATISPHYTEPAINELEHKFVQSIWNLLREDRENISFLRGHGELNNAEMYWIRQALFQSYNVDTVRIDKYNEKDSVFYEDIHALDTTDLLVVAKPKQSFTDGELFLLDQYIMNGGKVIWLIDRLNVIDDSLKVVPYFKTESNDSLDRLDKMIYKYGVGIEKNLVTDVQSGPTYDLREGKVIPQWYFYPLAGKEDSPFMKNVRDIRLKYPSSLKVNEGAPAKATTILESSLDYKIMPTVTRVGHVYMERYDPKADEKEYHEPAKFGILLEGTFVSNFPKDRINPEFIHGEGAFYKDSCFKNSMAVISDGDLIRNELTYENNRIRPFQLWSEPLNPNPIRSYGNEVLFLNLVDHMLGNEEMIPLRSRMKTQRLLSYHEVSKNRSYWQYVNLSIPVIIVIIFCGLVAFLRIRKYRKQV